MYVIILIVEYNKELEGVAMQKKLLDGVMFVLSLPYLIFHYTLVGIFFLFYLLFILFKYIGIGVSLPILLLTNKPDAPHKQPKKEKKAIVKKENTPHEKIKQENIKDDKLEIQDKKALEKENVVWILRPIEEVLSNPEVLKRPPINGNPETYRALYEKRKKLYDRCAKVTIFNIDSDVCAKDLAKLYGFTK